MESTCSVFWAQLGSFCPALAVPLGGSLTINIQLQNQMMTEQKTLLLEAFFSMHPHFSLFFPLVLLHWGHK